MPHRSTVAALGEWAGRTVSVSEIYGTLGRLADKGLVRARVEEPDGAPGRQRKLYTVEPAGARALVNAYTTLRTFGDGIMSELTELAKGKHA